MVGLLLAVVLGAAHAQDAEHGAQLAGLAGCAACHTAPDGAPLAGGYELTTDFGTFYGSNLTPDPVHGIGGWTFDDFVRAMRLGKDPQGRPYYPAFPYTAFTALTDADLADLWAWLRTVPADPRPDTPHDVLPRYRGRALLGLWRSLGFRKGPYTPDPSRSEAWNRGAYLVQGAGHCGGCHTPRSGVGIERRAHELAGSDAPPEPAPDLTPSPEALGAWTVEDWTTFLDMGMLPDGDFVGGEMNRVVEEGTAQLTDADREAIAAYLMALPPSRPRRHAP
ncbi:MAG: cytochrome c [Alphaproteobacteria bacterium]|nr:cytochrome c [Alphaproteobacteria bacterium]